ncbi:MAG TPA: Ig-like domain-containing protein [Kofleriaceae bacterium]
MIALLAVLAHVGCGSVTAKSSDAGGGGDDAPGGDDTTPPTVVSSTPSDQATNVDFRVNFTVTFSEPIAPASATLVTVPDAGCMPQLDAAGTRLSCNNPVDLNASTSYTVVVPTSVTDLAGNALAQQYTFGFHTSAVPDTTAPTITAVTPNNGAIGTVVRPPITVAFSEPMDQASVEAAFSFVSPSGATATFAWSTDGQTLTATPTADLAYGDQVVWQLATTATDLAGNALAAQQVTFRVRRSTTTTLTAIDYANTLAGVNTAGLFVGDNSQNQNYRAFLVYTLPSDAFEILGASLTVLQSISASSPFSTGTTALAIYVESVPYSAPIDNGEAVAPAACLGSALQCTGLHSRCLDAEVLSTTSSSTSGEARSVSSAKFLALVRSGLGQTGRTFAIRIRRGFLSSYTPAPCDDYFTDSDNVGDYLRYFDPGDGTVSNRPVMSITYTYP